VRLGLAPEDARVLAQKLAAGAQAGTEPVALLGGDMLVTARDLAALEQALRATLVKAHEEQPLSPGVAAERLRAAVAPEWPAEAFRDWLGRLAGRGAIVLDADAVRLVTHTAELDPGQKEIYERMMRCLEEAGLLAPAEGEWFLRSGAGERGRTLAEYAVRRGDALRLPDGAIVAASAWREMIVRLRREAAAGRTTFEVPEFKELFGLTRKHAIPLLEKLDDLGVTQRVGNRRRIRPG
jgi:selenocysteine-specific elongation factor